MKTFITSVQTWLADDRPLLIQRGFLYVAAAVLLLSLGLAWSSELSAVSYAPMFQVVEYGTFQGSGFTSDTFPSAIVPDWAASYFAFGLSGGTGAQHPVRVPIVVSGVLGFLAIHRGSRKLLAAALCVAVIGLLMAAGSSIASPGWLAVASAVVLTVLGSDLRLRTQ